MKYDVVIVGSGPNGLASALILQEVGLSVLLLEKTGTVGGGMRTKELMLNGYYHDVCSSVFPFVATSPFFEKYLPQLDDVELISPDLNVSHPFLNGRCVCLNTQLVETARKMGIDGQTYNNLVQPFIEHWDELKKDILNPVKLPVNPALFVKFGIKAIQPINWIGSTFTTQEVKGLWAGIAAHSMQPFTSIGSSSIGLILCVIGHVRGWPIIKGGAQVLANALLKKFISIGGTYYNNFEVKSIHQIPPYKVLLLDLTPKQVVEILQDELSPSYIKRLIKFKYGMSVFKVDWILSSQIPFSNEDCRKAGTIHLGEDFKNIALSEQMVHEGKISDHPFIIITQPSVFDSTRTPNGNHVAWAYCHVPLHSKIDLTNKIENEIEKYAPGFKDCIIRKKSTNTFDLERYNSNYWGGDINGGSNNLKQLFARPVLKPNPYRTSKKDIYICSASTPPGGGVHGMGGMNAAERILKECFK